MARNDGLRLSTQNFDKARAALSALGRDAGQYVASIGRAIERGGVPDKVAHQYATEIARKLAKPTNHQAVKTVVDLFVAAKAAATPVPAVPPTAPAPATS